MPIHFENITDHTGVRIYNFDTSKSVNEDDLNELKKLMQNRYVHPYVKLYVNDIKRLLTKATT